MKKLCFIFTAIFYTFSISGCGVIQPEPNPPVEHYSPQEIAKAPDSIADITNALDSQGIYVTRTGDWVKMYLPPNDFFEFGLDQQRYKNLNALYTILSFYNTYGKAPLIISGYTDSVGTEKQLLKRSKEQAKAIAAFFWAHNVPKELIIVQGYGDQNKLDTRSTPWASAANRRIEIKFSLQSPSSIP